MTEQEEEKEEADPLHDAHQTMSEQKEVVVRKGNMTNKYS
jgi:hypothetical protein